LTPEFLTAPGLSALSQWLLATGTHEDQSSSFSLLAAPRAKSRAKGERSFQPRSVKANSYQFLAISGWCPLAEESNYSE
jgi:hypothetical protein